MKNDNDIYKFLKDNNFKRSNIQNKNDPIVNLFLEDKHDDKDMIKSLRSKEKQLKIKDKIYLIDQIKEKQIKTSRLERDQMYQQLLQQNFMENQEELKRDQIFLNDMLTDQFSQFTGSLKQYNKTFQGAIDDPKSINTNKSMKIKTCYILPQNQNIFINQTITSSAINNRAQNINNFNQNNESQISLTQRDSLLKIDRSYKSPSLSSIESQQLQNTKQEQKKISQPCVQNRLSSFSHHCEVNQPLFQTDRILNLKEVLRKRKQILYDNEQNRPSIQKQLLPDNNKDLKSNKHYSDQIYDSNQSEITNDTTQVNVQSSQQSLTNLYQIKQAKSTSLYFQEKQPHQFSMHSMQQGSQQSLQKMQEIQSQQSLDQNYIQQPNSSFQLSTQNLKEQIKKNISRLKQSKLQSNTQLQLQDQYIKQTDLKQTQNTAIKVDSVSQRQSIEQNKDFEVMVQTPRKIIKQSTPSQQKYDGQSILNKIKEFSRNQEQQLSDINSLIVKEDFFQPIHDQIKMQLQNVSQIKTIEEQKFFTNIRHNRISLVKQNLLQNPKLVNSIDNQYYTGLHWAVKRNYEELATILINSGTDLNSKDYKGRTPYQLSIELEMFNIAKIIQLNL